MSLLDRFREAVFRLIMISALSRASNTAYTATSSTYDSQSPLRLSSRSSNKSSPAATSRHHHRSYHHYSSDSHHTEAVADCIEFIKKSANDDIRESSASSSSRSPVYDNSTEIVFPLPVM
ncbi:hypothetical protein L1887_31189 [Cichorium endivia]|nr:hypothetical protein L1887_31189 [Cichorium endivia]